MAARVLGPSASSQRSRRAPRSLPTKLSPWVRRARGERPRPSTSWESLTPIELEVVRHTAAGCTNPEIGQRMFISRATGKKHLAHVYAKLGITNRAELAREAARRLA